MLKEARRVSKPAGEGAVAMRKAEVKRETKETQVSVSLDLDGSGKHDVASGIGFLDHMLEQLARHGQIDLELRAEGDLHIDMHHTAEDVGIVIGQAVARALGDRRGIRRFSSVHLAMDEALTRVVIDVSGRPYLVWKVALPSAKLGNFDTELVREWFHAFAQNAGITLHVETLYGDNTHHIVETCFKGLARALREAIAIDERAPDAVPSTKGTLAGEAM
jgi:imidazoleglycerol-phosphate dehydratase